MHYFKTNSFNEAYLQLTRMFASQLMCDGVPVVSGRNHGELVENRHVRVEIEDSRRTILTLPFRKPSLRYMAGEVSCYMQETRSDQFGWYSRLWSDLDVDGEVQSNYGRKIFETDFDGVGISRFDYALAQLAANRCTKNAIVMLKDHRDLRKGYDKDRSCAMSQLFYIEGDRLYQDIQLRSSDMWLGLPYDIFWFSLVQQRMVSKLQYKYPWLKTGPIMFQAATLHVYKKHWARITQADLGADCVDVVVPVWDACAEWDMTRWLRWERQLRYSLQSCDDAYDSAANATREHYKSELDNMYLHPLWHMLGGWLVGRKEYAAG